MLANNGEEKKKTHSQVRKKAYSGSQESEVCPVWPMPCLANALFGQCPVWPMPCLVNAQEHLMLLRKVILSSSLFPKHPSVKSVKSYTLLRCLSSYFANSRSIAAISSGESGPTLLRNLATTSPCLLTKNFSKFQETSPLGSTALVSLA